MAHLRLQNLFDIIEETVPGVGKNAREYAELVLLLDDVSFSLVMRDAKENGKKAIDILRDVAEVSARITLSVTDSLPVIFRDASSPYKEIILGLDFPE